MLNPQTLEFLLLVLMPLLMVVAQLSLLFAIASCTWHLARVLRSFANWIDRK